MARLTKRGQDPYAPRASKAAKGKAGASKKAKVDGSSSSGGADGGSSRPLNGYQLFGKVNRQQIIEGTRGATPKDGFKLVAAAWKALSDEERRRWGDDAHKAAAAAVAGGEAAAAPAVAGGEAGGSRKRRTTRPPSESAAAKPKAARKSRRVSTTSSSGSSGDDGGSSRPLNGYQLFGKMNRQRIIDETEGATAKGGFALVAAAWKALSDEERAGYTDLAKQQGKEEQ